LEIVMESNKLGSNSLPLYNNNPSCKPKALSWFILNVLFVHHNNTPNFHKAKNMFYLKSKQTPLYTQIKSLSNMKGEQIKQSFTSTKNIIELHVTLKDVYSQWLQCFLFNFSFNELYGMWMCRVQSSIH
jgi:hypothetical protein